MRWPWAYAWEDVKKGDVVDLCTVFDDEEKKRYCITICIHRRPGAKLLKSRDPKGDYDFAQRSLINDIENGEDADDDEIAKWFPPRYEPKDLRAYYRNPAEGKPNRELVMIHPGGLGPVLQKKLEENRERIAKEKAAKLKAAPPIKK